MLKFKFAGQILIFFLQLATGKLLLGLNSGLEHQDYKQIFGKLF